MARTKQTGRKRKNNAANDNQNSEGTNPKHVKLDTNRPTDETATLRSGTGPISPGMRGFLFMYKVGSTAPVADVLQMLSDYADQFYRIDGKSCYFRETGGSSGDIFIETDMDDPGLLVDAIFTDMLESPEGGVAEKLKHCVKLFPVMVTCTTDSEDVIQTIKSVLEHKTFAENKAGGWKEVLMNKIDLSGKYFRENRQNGIKEAVVKHIRLNGVRWASKHTPTCKRVAHKKAIHVRSLYETVENGAIKHVCCVILMTNFNSFKGYSVQDVINKSEGPKFSETTVRPNTKGFLISFPENDYRDIASKTIKLLHLYADRLRPKTGKDSFFFKEKVAVRPNQSPLFIESNFHDPSLLTDAIYTDLVTSGECMGAEKLTSCQLLPVNMTGEGESKKARGRSKEKVKDLLSKFFQGEESGKCFAVSTDVDGLFMGETITAFLQSKGATRVDVSDDMDVYFSVRMFGKKVLCLSMLSKYAKFQGFVEKLLEEEKM